MITWLEHSKFQKEVKTLSKKERALPGSIEKIKRLLAAHFFDEEIKGTVIKPGKIHRINIDNDITGRELWKVEVMVPNLRPSQWPRLWFMVDGETIIFLVIASHVNNYDNNEMDRLAKERYLDLLDT